MVISRVGIVKYILLFTFLANSFLGYPYSNITLLMLPLNEWMLVISLILISPSIPNIVKTYPILIPILLWSVGYLLLSVPFGFAKYGIWAGRDALHLVEVWWLVVTLFVLSRVDVEYEVKRLINIILYLFIVKAATILLGDYAKGVFIIQGAQSEIDLFGSNAGFSLIVFLMLWMWVTKLKISAIVPILVLLFFAILQSRYMYVGLISSVFVYIFIKGFSLSIVLKSILYFVALIAILYGISNITFLDEYTRFGIKSIAPDQIFQHLLSSTGKTDNENFSGAASGVGQRIHWFLMSWNMAVNDVFIFLFGQGFGPVLTDFNSGNVVREPHNSYLSVFARTGLIGFIMWIFFHIYINIRIFFILKKNRNSIKNIFATQILLVAFMVMHAMYWFALVEPAFESPYASINFYIIISIMIYLMQNICRLKKE